jgi:hypothetical protein
MLAIDAVYNLQNYDNSIVDMSAKVKAGQLAIQQLDKTLAELDQKIEELTQELKNITQASHLLEKDILFKDNSIEKLNNRYMMLKTEKELSGFNNEMAKLKSEKESLEEALLLKMEEAESTTEKTKITKDKKRKLELEFVLTRARHESEIANLKVEITKTQELRSEFILTMKDEWLEKYEQKKSRLKPAVALLERETCQGCRLKVQSNVLMNIKNRDRLSACPNCGRLLIDKTR